MKVFMITWAVFCLLVIVGLVIAYTTDQLPGVPALQHAGLEVENWRKGAGEACSPCEENLKHLKKARERWERERNAKAAAGAASDAP